MISQEEHKTIMCASRISGMALSNQNELPAFLSPWKVNLKVQYLLLFSSNPLFRFRLVASRDNFSNSSSRIWPFSVSFLPIFGRFISHLLEFSGWEEFGG
jgi:hypothetical protein